MVIVRKSGREIILSPKNHTQDRRSILGLVVELLRPLISPSSLHAEKPVLIR